MQESASAPSLPPDNIGELPTLAYEFEVVDLDAETQQFGDTAVDIPDIAGAGPCSSEVGMHVMFLYPYQQHKAVLN